MENAHTTPAVVKEAPRQLSVTQLRSMTSAVLDDARAGHVTYIERGGRLAAAVVPVGVGQAYEAGADTRRAVLDEIGGHVWTTVGLIGDALDGLLEQFRDPATKQAATERLQRLVARHHGGDTEPGPQKTHAE